MEKERGVLIVLSGPAGVGKGTVRKTLLAQEDVKFQYSISATTRAPREGEVDGVDYFFKTHDEFEKMVYANKFLEWAEFVDNCYGTPIEYVEETLRSGKDVMLEIEVQGAMKVREIFKDALLIFLAPPNLDELLQRILNRGTETEEVIHRRMNMAREEIDMMNVYDYVVENDEVTLACERIKMIAFAEHFRRERVENRYKKMLEVD